MKKTTMIAMAAIALGFAPWSAKAQTLNLNICEKLVEDLFIPPTLSELRKCKTPTKTLAKIAYCAGLPHCCLPGVCLSDPICYTLEKVQTAAGYWKHKGDVHCSTKGITPADLVKKFLMDQLVNAADLLTGATLDAAVRVVEVDSDTMFARAKPIPTAWKDYVKALIAPVHNGGANGFANGDLDVVRLISASDWNAKMYLKSGYGAITLGNLIVVNAAQYDVIMNQTISSWDHNDTRLKAAEMLVHEMVHVKQYRSLGRPRFLKEYVMANLLHGFKYCLDSFEQEAYGFSARVAQAWGGPYCNATVSSHNTHITDCKIPMSPVTCNLDKGVCGVGQAGCTRSPTMLHRTALNCNGSPLSDTRVHDISLTSGYGNRTCDNRHRELCIDDGSYDIYYAEWCDYAGPTCKQISPKEYACDPGVRPSGSCKVKVVHQNKMTCAGVTNAHDVVTDLTKTTMSDYTCGNRFYEQCVADGRWDSYNVEWCEYACQ